VTTLIIPAANTTSECRDLLSQLLDSIKVGGYEDWKVGICFDNCGEDFIDYFKWKYFFKFWTVHKNKNLYFAANVNSGLRFVERELPGEDYFIVNQDTILPHREYLESMKNGGLSSACQVDLSDELRRDWGEKLNSIQDTEVIRNPVLKFPGFCYYINSEVIKTIGYLDEGFRKCFDDDDYCIRAKLAGFPVEATNIKVHHPIKREEGKPSTTVAYSLNDLGIYMARFRLKYSIPPDIKHADFNQWILNHHEFTPEMKEN